MFSNVVLHYLHSNVSIVSVPNEGYSLNASCTQHKISTFLFIIFFIILLKQYEQLDDYDINDDQG